MYVYCDLLCFHAGNDTLMVSTRQSIHFNTYQLLHATYNKIKMIIAGTKLIPFFGYALLRLTLTPMTRTRAADKSPPMSRACD